MISSLESATKYVKNAPYGFLKPLSYVALIPLVSVIVKEIRLNALESELHDTNDLKIPPSRSFETTCKAHFQGAIVQAIALSVLFPGVGSCLAMIAAVDAIRTVYRAYSVSNITKFYRVPSNYQQGYVIRMPHLIGR